MADLDYVAANWRKPSYEIWEEVEGTHFYTLMVQRRAMLDGAMIATRMKDPASAARYTAEATEISKLIETFWNPTKQIIVVTKNRVDGLDYKKSELDTQVLLASLHASNDEDGFFNPANDKILSTFAKLFNAFSTLYKDNRDHPAMAPAIGRYPEDKYNGYDASHGGNGWMLLTAAMAEICYRVKNTWLWTGQIPVTFKNLAFLSTVSKHTFIAYVPGQTITPEDWRFNWTLQNLMRLGDRFMARVRYHTEKDGGHLSEQWNKDTGKQQGAEDLTWSYVSFLTAYNARKRALITA